MRLSNKAKVLVVVDGQCWLQFAFAVHHRVNGQDDSGKDKTLKREHRISHFQFIRP